MQTQTSTLPIINFQNDVQNQHALILYNCFNNSTCCLDVAYTSWCSTECSKTKLIDRAKIPYKIYPGEQCIIILNNKVNSITSQKRFDLKLTKTIPKHRNIGTETLPIFIGMQLLRY